MDFGATAFYNSYLAVAKIVGNRVEYRPGAGVRQPIPSERIFN